MLYAALYMAALRTQIYLTREQRRRLDERARREGRALADLIREAVDEFLAAERARPAAEVLAESFGAAPEFDVPARGEWAERETRLLGGRASG